MTAVLLTLGTFAAFWLVGLAFLCAVGASISELRVILTAPVVGSAAFVLPLFLLGSAGLPMDRAGLPLVVTLIVASTIVVSPSAAADPSGGRGSPRRLSAQSQSARTADGHLRLQLARQRQRRHGVLRAVGHAIPTS